MPRSKSSSSKSPNQSASISYPDTSLGSSSSTQPLPPSKTSSSAQWKSIRPWKPPSTSELPLKLQVIDIGPTFVVLSLYHPNSLNPSPSNSRRVSFDGVLPFSGGFNLEVPGESSGGNSRHDSVSTNSSGPEYIVKVDGKEWESVTHAGTSRERDRESSLLEDEVEPETIVIVYNLEPGREYVVELEVVRDFTEQQDGRGGAWSTLVETAPGGNGDRVSGLPQDEPKVETSKRASTSRHSVSSVVDVFPPSSDSPLSPEPTEPPPPYSLAISSSTVEDETTLRNILKSLRSSHKTTESGLRSAIANLKKSIEKGGKEEMRIRQGMAKLEEGIRKSKERKEEMGKEAERVEEEVKELEIQEERLIREVERLRGEEREGRNEDADENSLLDELRDELVELEKQEKAIKKEKRQREKQIIASLETELASLEAELQAASLPSHSNIPSRNKTFPFGPSPKPSIEIVRSQLPSTSLEMLPSSSESPFPSSSSLFSSTPEKGSGIGFFGSSMIRRLRSRNNEPLNPTSSFQGPTALDSGKEGSLNSQEEVAAAIANGASTGSKSDNEDKDVGKEKEKEKLVGISMGMPGRTFFGGSMRRKVDKEKSSISSNPSTPGMKTSDLPEMKDLKDKMSKKESQEKVSKKDEKNSKEDKNSKKEEKEKDKDAPKKAQTKTWAEKVRGK